MSRDSFSHRKRMVVRPGGVRRLVLPAVGVVAILMVLAQAVLAYSASGTVDGVDWAGYSYINWDLDGGHIDYWGDSFTEAEEVIDQLYVSTLGSEYCGPWRFDTDWTETNNVYNTWLVGKSGDGGWALVGECAWFYLNPYIIISNQGYHEVWEGNDNDSGDSDNWEQLPW